VDSELASLSLKDTDLIVDVEDTAEGVAKLGSVLQIVFRNLHRGKEWRSVTFAGTSMPENFQDFARDGVHLIERKEWRIWGDLAGASLPYRLDYGDYATVPIRDQQTKYSSGFPISVRYTLKTQFLIPRGVRTRGEGSKDQGPQLVKHANTIMKYQGRDRLDCWADDEIDQIARKEATPNTLGHWVSIGVNRHITRVRADLP
jgi:Beta protein